MKTWEIGRPPSPLSLKFFLFFLLSTSSISISPLPASLSFSYLFFSQNRVFFGGGRGETRASSGESSLPSFLPLLGTPDSDVSQIVSPLTHTHTRISRISIRQAKKKKRCGKTRHAQFYFLFFFFLVIRSVANVNNFLFTGKQKKSTVDSFPHVRVGEMKERENFLACKSWIFSPSFPPPRPKHDKGFFFASSTPSPTPKKSDINFFPLEAKKTHSKNRFFFETGRFYFYYFFYNRDSQMLNFDRRSSIILYCAVVI